MPLTLYGFRRYLDSGRRLPLWGGTLALIAQNLSCGYFLLYFAPFAAAYVLCSPHNPTGNVWSARQLEMVADLCQRHGATLLVDEIHAPLVLPGARFVPFGSLRHEMAGHAFVFTSASKG